MGRRILHFLVAYLAPWSHGALASDVPTPAVDAPSDEPLIVPRGVRSSYKSNVTFGEVIGSVCFALGPRRIVEYGVLDGFSLSALSSASPSDAAILAVDMFGGVDDKRFEGNHADEHSVRNDFKDDEKVRQGVSNQAQVGFTRIVGSKLNAYPNCLHLASPGDDRPW
jgi:hypothetical protein